MRELFTARQRLCYIKLTGTPVSITEHGALRYTPRRDAMSRSFPRATAWCVFLVLISVLAWPAAVRGADGDPPGQPLTSVDGITMRARPAFHGTYRPGSWLPLYLELENEGPDREVELQATLRSGASYATTLDLPNNSRKRVTLYAYLPLSMRRLNIRLLHAGTELQSQQVELQPTVSRAHTVAVVSDGATAPRPPTRLPDGASLSSTTFQPADLPTHALGLTSFDLLVLSDLPTADLSQAQIDALRAWVIRGGQLLIDGGPGAERTLAGMPADLQPATITEFITRPADVLFAAGDAAPNSVPLIRAEPTTDSAGRTAYLVPIAGLPAEAQLIEQRYARGAVGLLPLPLGHPTLLTATEMPRIWADLLEQTSALSSNAGAPDLTLDAFVEGNLASALTGLPALQFPPVGVLALLIGIYIVVVGPGVYLVLRRLDRQALGWVIVPALTLMFAAGAYAFGYAQRGGDLVLNQLTYIETFDATPAGARARSFAGLFSPTRQTYDLDIQSSGFEAPLLRPISLQGPWDATLGGGSGILLQPEIGGAAVRDFEVAQWAMRALTADTLVDVAALQARLTLDGATLAGVVENTSDRLFEDVVLVQGDRVVRLGNLAPGEQRDVELPAHAEHNGRIAAGANLSSLIYGDIIDQSGRMDGAPIPSHLQLRIRILDAIFAYGPNPRGGHPLLIGWSATPTLDLVPAELRAERQHLALAVSEPQLIVSSAPIDLGAGWLHKRFTNAQAGLCYGALGVGVGLGNDPVLLQLALPRDLYGFRPTELALLSDADGPWMAETQIELYNWEQDAWEVLPGAGRSEPVLIDRPAQFVGSHGKLRARLASTAADPSFGCIYLDATMKGTMP
jgi:hypothetical protein